jgi:hypothetical protein
MSFKDDLIGVANAEWEWFGKDVGSKSKFIDSSGKTTTAAKTGSKANRRKETVEPYSSRIADYWLALPSAEYNRLLKSAGKGVGRLDGTVDFAWSAAFVSYCMQTAGAGTQFPYAAGHATWMVQAIKAKQKNKLKAALVGYRPGEIALAVGDIIGKPREAGVTYDNAVATGWFYSHSDIVVAIDAAKKKAYVIGGNVGQSVGMQEVSIDAHGRLNDSGGWIVHIRNNIETKQAELTKLSNADIAALKVG